MIQTHYFEIRAIPQIELTQVQIMNQFMQSIHQTLIYYDGGIGLSFPCYTQKQNKTLGGGIRFFGSKDQLSLFRDDLINQPSLRDYAIFFDIKDIPIAKNYVCFSRVRAKGQSALRRSQKRLQEQQKWSEEVKNKMVEKWGNVELKYPHCHIKSSSTGQSFIIWIRQESQNKPIRGKFNSYGLSNKSTVPNF